MIIYNPNDPLEQLTRDKLNNDLKKEKLRNLKLKNDEIESTRFSDPFKRWIYIIFMSTSILVNLWFAFWKGC